MSRHHRWLSLSSLVLLTSLLLGATVGSASAASAQVIPSVFTTDLFAMGDLALATELIHDDALFATPDGSLVGPAGLVAFLAGFHDGFSDVAFTVTDQSLTEVALPVSMTLSTENANYDNPRQNYIVETTLSTVTVHWTMTGTHDGTYLDHPATGTGVTLDGQTILQIRDEQIVGGWVAYDRVNLIDQLITPQAPEGQDMPDHLYPR